MTFPDVPKPEYPRPQLVREAWLCLNGRWQFEVDRGDSGLERGLRSKELDGEILVPFAPESEASGIGDVDFLTAVWYRRSVQIPADWSGQRVLLHFGAVDHDTTVWVNDVEVARHRGGFTPFTADLGGVAEPGEEATIVVRARDPRSGPQARGKQSVPYANAACNYTRTTGIWQTVWMEPVPDMSLRRPRIVPQLASGSFAVTTGLTQNRRGASVRVTLLSEGVEVAVQEVPADLDLAPTLTLVVPQEHRRAWSVEDPHLYDLVIELRDADGEVVDSARSYAGLRSVAIDGTAIRINGRPVFQRLVLDQGYWPDTLMTSPSDEALVRDIELSMAAGFNGARLHQKVFEERFLYHADRLGYLVWGEFGDWGAGGYGPDHDHQQPTASFVTQWLEALERDLSHPSIIGWCPLNETHQVIGDQITVLDDVTHAMYLATKLADPTRPVLDASGYSHRVRGADVYDSHNYEQDPQAFADQMGDVGGGEPYVNLVRDRPMSVPYAGQPYFVSEFGGIWWDPDEPETSGDDRSESWGYGQRVAGEEEFYSRLQGLFDVLLQNPSMFGYCYTQLTDVFQEQNGVYDFDRGLKLDVPRIRAMQQQVAAYEKES
jgi:beta-galactosidase/beta-glucuronidase